MILKRGFDKKKILSATITYMTAELYRFVC